MLETLWEALWIQEGMPVGDKAMGVTLERKEIGNLTPILEAERSGLADGLALGQEKDIKKGEERQTAPRLVYGVLASSPEVEEGGKEWAWGDIRSSVRDTVGLRCLGDIHLEMPSRQLSVGDGLPEGAD